MTQNSKDLEEEDEEINKHIEAEKQDTQTSIENEVEKNQENSIEPIDPSLPRDWKYSSSHP